jgi:hypothetical protein
VCWVGVVLVWVFVIQNNIYVDCHT